MNFQIKGFSNYYFSFESGNVGIVNKRTGKKIKTLSRYTENTWALYQNGVKTIVRLTQVIFNLEPVK